MCYILQVCGDTLLSPVALLNYSFVKYNVVEVYTMIPFCHKLHFQLKCTMLLMSVCVSFH